VKFGFVILSAGNFGNGLLNHSGNSRLVKSKLEYACGFLVEVEVVAAIFAEVIGLVMVVTAGVTKAFHAAAPKSNEV
jgi:hypothetical protein